MQKLLVTGAAGFIGFHLSKRLLQNDAYQVVGLDSINDYYDPGLKLNRLAELGIERSEITSNKKVHKDNFSFVQANLEDRAFVADFFKQEQFDYVINLAAQAGVRYSLQNPHAYIESNMEGFLNVLEGCRHQKVKHLLYASSSSVYGLNTKMPFAVGDTVDHPVALYGATKKANELFAHSYSYLYNMPVTGLRFFTVYGPWGRPDMALFIFTKNIIEGKPISVYNNGNMRRDFTYVDDIVESLVRLITHVPAANENFDRNDPDPATSVAPYQLHNIGNHSPVNLMDFIKIIEQEVGKEAIIQYEPLQPGDIEETYADVEELMKAVDFKPSTSIRQGIKNFTNWYREYYKV